MKSEAVLYGIKDERNLIHVIKRRKDKWSGYILRRNFFIKHLIERNIQRTGRRERRLRQLLMTLRERRATGT
jgi:hypothetical protein